MLIAGDVKRIADLKQGAVVGTVGPAAARRSSCIAGPTSRSSPCAAMSTRGCAKREAAAKSTATTLLALAGLKRLGLEHVGAPVPEDEMLPAVGQGAICIECRVDDARTLGWLAAIDHGPTATCVKAEHAMLSVLDGSCRTPIAGHAVLFTDGVIHLRGLIAKPDGSQLIATANSAAAIVDAEALGRDAGHELLRRGGPGFLST